jgi:hypothetical protein
MLTRFEVSDRADGLEHLRQLCPCLRPMAGLRGRARLGAAVVTEPGAGPQGQLDG